jgi:hypothetical protein
MKLLIFSDIHGDTKALERLVAMPADAYFVAGDLATFSQGLDKMGPILQKAAAPVYVMPGKSRIGAGHYCILPAIWLRILPQSSD